MYIGCVSKATATTIRRVPVKYKVLFPVIHCHDILVTVGFNLPYLVVCPRFEVDHTFSMIAFEVSHFESVDEFVPVLILADATYCHALPAIELAVLD